MKVRLSKLALGELNAILESVRIENPLAAERLEGRFRRAFDRIALFPKAAQEVDKRPGVRPVPLVCTLMLCTMELLTAK